MKIIFVGIHNKPGLNPLCSTTKSGKLINRVIRELPKGVKIESKKTNLFDVDQMPEPHEMHALTDDWYWKNTPGNDDIIVLLGALVHEQFRFKDLKIVKLPHPSSIWSFPRQDEYVDSAILKIKSKML